MQDDLIIQRPGAAATQATELLLVFHGVGSRAEDMLPLGQALASHRPNAWVVSVRSPGRSEFGSGWQWFSVQGVTEESRPSRVDAAMPGFMETVRAWQQESGIAPEKTTLIGFSQGAIMSLEATQQNQSIAGRIIAISGRFAQPPRTVAVGTIFHMMHGEQDRVMPLGLAVDAERQLHALGAQVTLDRYPGLGHNIDARVVERIVQRLGESAPQK